MTKPILNITNEDHKLANMKGADGKEIHKPDVCELRHT